MDDRATAIAACRQFIKDRRWQFAKTMPDNPHEYTVRRWRPGEAGQARFEAFVVAIREHGYARRFGGREYKYLDLDGWKYWTMGSPLEATVIINRAELSGESKNH